jgi:hypothetical protein
MATLQEIRAKLKEQEANKGGGNNTPGDNAVYPFWNIKEGESSTLRFLPDGNTENTFFWQERLMIKLPFPGIKGETDSRPVIVSVPCMEMYGKTCPILSEVRGWFKDPNLEDMGRKYWKKRSYIFQGFVTDDALKEDNPPENPIRRFIIGPQIFQIIKQALMDPDMEDLPTDYTAGVDFRLNKTSKGGYADYSTSNWARRDRPLSETEMKAVEEHGLKDLAEFLPKEPDETVLKVISEMFEASVDGEPYDPDRWSQYYRPAGMASKTGDPNKESKPESKPAPKAESKPEPKAESKVDVSEEEGELPWNEDKTEDKAEEKSEGSGSAQDILSMIRSRQNQ